MAVGQDGHQHGAGALVLGEGGQFRAGLPDQPDHGVVQGGAAARLQVQRQARPGCPLRRRPVRRCRRTAPGTAGSGPATDCCSRTNAANPPTVSSAMALIDPERSRRTYTCVRAESVMLPHFRPRRRFCLVAGQGCPAVWLDRSRLQPGSDIIGGNSPNNPNSSKYLLHFLCIKCKNTLHGKQCNYFGRPPRAQAGRNTGGDHRRRAFPDRRTRPQRLHRGGSLRARGHLPPDLLQLLPCQGRCDPGPRRRRLSQKRW